MSSDYVLIVCAGESIIIALSMLIDSINPEHYGDEDVKLAIALQMFGGWSRGQRKRGDSHMLLMGTRAAGNRPSSRRSMNSHHARRMPLDKMRYRKG